MTGLSGKLACAIGLAMVALGALVFPTHATSAEGDEPVRILFIGNSYTGQIRKAVTDLIKASPQGATTELEFIAPGGKTLAFHLENEGTRARIAEGNWDFVVLQDQSQTPAVFPDRFLDAAIELDKLIDAAGAQTVFYMTWGRRDGDKQNAQRFPDYESMQEALSENYERAARRCDALLAPVGEAWAEVRGNDADLGRELYKNDGSHPSNKGAYLAACVFYMTLFPQELQAIDFDGGLPEEERTVLQRAAHEAVDD